MDIAHIHLDNGGAFFVQSAGRRIGELRYTRQDQQIVVNSTWVEPRARGRGLAESLVESAVRVARHHDWVVVPACSYVEYAFNTHPEWSDRLAVRASQDLSMRPVDRREQCRA